MLKGLKILISDNNTRSRGSLKEVLKTIIINPAVDFVKKNSEIKDKLENGKNYDLIFIRSGKNIMEVGDIIGESRAFASSKNLPPPLIIICLKGKDQEVSYVAQLYLTGVHGFICEPFSAEKLLELIVVSREQSTVLVNDNSKEIQAAGFLMTDALRLVDKLAEARIKGITGGGYELKDLKLVSQSLERLFSKIDREKFIDIILSKSKDAKPSSRKLGEVVAKVVKYAPHPGILLREALTTRNIAPIRFLSIAKISEQDLTQLLESKISLTIDMAKEVARVLGQTTEYWIKAQADYEKYKKSITKDEK